VFIEEETIKGYYDADKIFTMGPQPDSMSNICFFSFNFEHKV